MAPSDTTKFHPVFVNELNKGRESSSCKKPIDTRRKEILDYSISTLLDLIIIDTPFWLSTPSLATEMAAIVKAGKKKNCSSDFPLRLTIGMILLTTLDVLLKYILLKMPQAVYHKSLLLKSHLVPFLSSTIINGVVE